MFSGRELEGDLGGAFDGSLGEVAIRTRLHRGFGGQARFIISECLHSDYYRVFFEGSFGEGHAKATICGRDSWVGEVEMEIVPTFFKPSFTCLRRQAIGYSETAASHALMISDFTATGFGT
ncbi:MAG: hypothetical protein ACD_40C00240G0002 [uncultured bacterium]|nr:MAG: hypothetical protein ACD_40C00240G0002 [uncultured bacterium]